MVVAPSPRALVERDVLHTGYFQAPFRHMNLADAPLPGGRRSGAWQRFRLKEWVGFGIPHPEVYVGVMIQNAKYLATGTIYAADLASGQVVNHTRPGLPGARLLAPTLWAGKSAFHTPGLHIRYQHALEKGFHRIEVEARAGGGRPAIQACWFLQEDLSRVQPLVASLPVRGGLHAYTHKAPLPVEGWLSVGGRRYEYRPDRDVANLDENRSLYPYRSHWRWGTLTGFDARGRLLCLNLAQHEFSDEEALGENCLWLAGRLSLLGRLEMTPPVGREGEWSVQHAQGRLALTFRPMGGGLRERRNLGLLKVDYHQQVGRFRGFVLDDAGERIVVRDMVGVIERMEARF